MRRRYINGKLEDYDFQHLLDKVKEMKESLFTTLEYKDYLYDFTIRAEELFTIIDENTEWQFFIHKSLKDSDDDAELISNGNECCKLLEKDLIKKMDEYRDRIINGEFDK